MEKHKLQVIKAKGKKEVGYQGTPVPVFQMIGVANVKEL